MSESHTKLQYTSECSVSTTSKYITGILEPSFSLLLTCQSMGMFERFCLQKFSGGSLKNFSKMVFFSLRSHCYSPNQVIILFLNFISLLANFCFYSCSYIIPSLQSYQRELMKATLGRVTLLQTFYGLIITLGRHPKLSLDYTGTQHCPESHLMPPSFFFTESITLLLHFSDYQTSSCFRALFLLLKILFPWSLPSWLLVINFQFEHRLVQEASPDHLIKIAP